MAYTQSELQRLMDELNAKIDSQVQSRNQEITSAQQMGILNQADETAKARRIVDGVDPALANVVIPKSRPSFIPTPKSAVPAPLSLPTGPTYLRSTPKSTAIDFGALPTATPLSDKGLFVPKVQNQVTLAKTQQSAITDNNLTKKSLLYGSGMQKVNEAYQIKMANGGAGGDDLYNAGMYLMEQNKDVIDHAHKMEDKEGMAQALEWGKAIADPNYWKVNQSLSLPSNASIMKYQLGAGIIAKGLDLTGIGIGAGMVIEAAGVAAATHKEASMEAAGVYQDIYDAKIAEGWTPEAAHSAAIIPAQEDYWKNIAILAPTNALEQLTVFGLGGKYLTKAVEATKDAMKIEKVASTATKVLKETGKLAATGVEEAGQEGLQYAAQMTSEKKPVDSLGLQENMIGGLTMGVGMAGVGRGISLPLEAAKDNRDKKVISNRLQDIANIPTTPSSTPAAPFHGTPGASLNGTIPQRTAQEEADVAGGNIPTAQTTSTSSPSNVRGQGMPVGTPGATVQPPATSGLVPQDMVQDAVTQGLTKDQSWNILDAHYNGTPPMTEEEHGYLYDAVSNPTTTVEEEGVVSGGDGVLPVSRVQAIVENHFGAKVPMQDNSYTEYQGPEGPTLQMAKSIAKAFGYKTMVVEPTTAEADRFNGFIDHETGTVILNSKSDNPLHAVMGHELTHAMEVKAGSIYKILRDEIEAAAGAAGGVQSWYVSNWSKKNGNKTWNDLSEQEKTHYTSEFVADLMQEASTAEGFYKQLLVKSKDAAQAFLDGIKEIIAKLKGMPVADQYSVKPYIENWEKVQAACEKAFAEFAQQEIKPETKVEEKPAPVIAPIDEKIIPKAKGEQKKEDVTKLSDEELTKRHETATKKNQPRLTKRYGDEVERRNASKPAEVKKEDTPPKKTSSKRGVKTETPKEETEKETAPKKKRESKAKETPEKDIDQIIEEAKKDIPQTAEDVLRLLDTPQFSLKRKESPLPAQVFINDKPFDIAKMEPVKNRMGMSTVCKPASGGIWTSSFISEDVPSQWARLTAEGGWTTVRESNIDNIQISVIISDPKANVLHVTNRNETEKLFSQYGKRNGRMGWLDWEQIAKHYDAVHFTQETVEANKDLLDGFDIESTIWLNNRLPLADKVAFLNNKRYISDLKIGMDLGNKGLWDRGDKLKHLDSMKNDPGKKAVSDYINRMYPKDAQFSEKRGMLDVIALEGAIIVEENPDLSLDDFLETLYDWDMVDPVVEKKIVTIGDKEAFNDYIVTYGEPLFEKSQEFATLSDEEYGKLKQEILFPKKEKKTTSTKRKITAKGVIDVDDTSDSVSEEEYQKALDDYFARKDEEDRVREKTDVYERLYKDLNDQELLEEFESAREDNDLIKLNFIKEEWFKRFKNELDEDTTVQGYNPLDDMYSPYKLPKITLSHEEERVIGRKAKEGDERAIVDLLGAHNGIAYASAKRYLMNKHGFTLEDLAQEARLSLVKTIKEKYDPEAETRLVSLAAPNMRHAILRMINLAQPLSGIPERHSIFYSHILDVQKQFQDKNNRKPDMEELYESLKNDPKIRASKYLSQVMGTIVVPSGKAPARKFSLEDFIEEQRKVESIDTPMVAEEGSATKKDVLVGTGEAEIIKNAYMADLREILGAAMYENLTDKQATVVYLIYFSNNPKLINKEKGTVDYSVVGKLMGVSGEAVSQLHKKAISKLKESKELKGTEIYLTEKKEGESTPQFSEKMDGYYTVADKVVQDKFPNVIKATPTVTHPARVIPAYNGVNEKTGQRISIPEHRTAARTVLGESLPEVITNLLKSNGVKSEEIRWADLESIEGDKISKIDLRAHLKFALNRVKLIAVVYGDHDNSEDYVNDHSHRGEHYSAFWIGDEHYFADVNHYDGGEEYSITATHDGPDDHIIFKNDYRTLEGDNWQEDMISTLGLVDMTDEESEEYSRYTVSGPRGEYQNIIITVPDYEIDYDSPHWWNGGNVVSHIRTTERADILGSRLLHLEESQSDVHESNKEAKTNVQFIDFMKKMQDKYGVIDQDDFDGEYLVDGVDINKLTPEETEIFDRVGKYAKNSVRELAYLDTEVIDYPYPTTEAWTLLNIKQLIASAIEGGYDGVSLTNARLSARYQGPTAEQFKTYYDEIIPKVVNKYIKKWGLKLDTTKINVSIDRWEWEEVPYFIIPFEMRQDINKNGQPQFSEKRKERRFVRSNRNLFSKEFNDQILKSIIFGTDASYVEKHFDEWISYAQGIIAKGLDKAVEEFRSSDFEPGQKTALGTYLSTALDVEAKRLHDSGDIAGGIRTTALASDIYIETAIKLTEAGQEVAAAGLAKQFTIPSVLSNLHRQSKEAMDVLKEKNGKLHEEIQNNATQIVEGMQQIHEETVDQVMEELAPEIEKIVKKSKPARKTGRKMSADENDALIAKIEEHYVTDETPDTPVKKTVRVMNELFKGWFSEKKNHEDTLHTSQRALDIVRRFFNPKAYAEMEVEWNKIRAGIKTEYGMDFAIPQDFFQYYFAQKENAFVIEGQIKKVLDKKNLTFDDILSENDIQSVVREVVKIMRKPFGPTIEARIRTIVAGNKRDAASSLAKRIVKMATVKKSSPKYNKISDMMNMITKIARESLPKTVKVPRDPMDLIVSAMNNWKEYQKVWMAAEQEIITKFPDNVDEIAALQKFFNRPINDVISNGQLERVLSKGLKGEGMTIADVVKKHYTQQKLTVHNLAEKLVEQVNLKAEGISEDELDDVMGLRPEDAVKLANLIEGRFNELVQAKKEKLLEGILKGSKTAQRKTLIEKLIAYSNIGAFGHEQYIQAICEKIGIPTITPELALMVTDLCDRIQTTTYPVLRHADTDGKRYEIRQCADQTWSLQIEEDNPYRDLKPFVRKIREISDKILGEVPMNEIASYNTVEEAIDAAPSNLEWRDYLEKGGVNAQNEYIMELNYILASFKDKSWLDKLSTVQTISMLLSGVTALRNVGGNEFIYWIKGRLSKILQVSMDVARSKVTGTNRTISLKRNNSLRSYMKGLIIGSSAAYRGYTPRGLEGQYELGFAPRFKKYKDIFADGWFPTFTKMNKLLNVGMSYLETAMRIELLGMDQASVTRAYEDKMTEMASLYLINSGQKITRENIQRTIATMEDSLVEMSIEYAKKMTFQNENSLTKATSGLKKLLNANQDWGAGDVIIKFTKVPVNLSILAWEFSPFGFINGAIDLVKAHRASSDQKEELTAKAIESISDALVGSIGLTGFGVWAGMMGFMTGKDDDDDRKKAYDRATGRGSYRVNISALNRYLLGKFTGKSVSTEWKNDDNIWQYSWAEPIATPTAIGVEIGKEIKKQGSWSKVSYPAAIVTGLGALFDKSVFQNTVDLFRTAPGETLSGDTIIQNYLDLFLTNVGASFVPALARQTRSYLDPYARTTWEGTTWDVAKAKIMDRLPGASTKLKPQLDLFGDPIQKNPGVKAGSMGSAIMSYSSPFYVNKFEVPSTKSRTIINDLYSRTGESAVLPSTPDKSVEMDKVTYKLTADEYEELRTYRGDEIDKLINQSLILSNPSISDAKKIERLKAIYSEAGGKARDHIKKGLKASRGIK